MSQLVDMFKINQAGPSQSLKDLATQSTSNINVPMATGYAYQQFPQFEHPTNMQFVDLAQIHQPVQYCYNVNVAHQATQLLYRFHPLPEVKEFSEEPVCG